MIRKFPITKLKPKLQKTISRYFEGNYNEYCLFASFDENNEFKEYELIKGTNSSKITISVADIKKIIENFTFKNILVIHNHPKGSFSFSKSDKDSFTIWKNLEDIIGCNFLDLLIVTPRIDYYSKISDPILEFEIQPFNSEVRELETIAGVKKINIKVFSPIENTKIMDQNVIIDTLESDNIYDYIMDSYLNQLNTHIFYIKGDERTQWK